MATKKISAKAIQQRHRLVVKEIEKKFGKVIDLESTPFVLVEIIREFGHRFDTNGGGGSGGGGGVSGSIAVGITPPPAVIENTLIMKSLLTMQKDIKALGRKLDQITANK